MQPMTSAHLRPLMDAAVHHCRLVPGSAPGAVVAVFHRDQVLDTGELLAVAGYGTRQVVGGQRVGSAGEGNAVPTDDQRPDADTVFRIASMTKSFTASAVLQLRDAGLLRLDDPVDAYVPQAGGWGATIRNLLTMTSGLNTDDPWGDRQQDLREDDFRQLLGQGLTRAWAPNTRYEYSNTGYAVLGLVISSVTAQPYSQAVRHRLLEPLGLSSTTFQPNDFATRAATGYDAQDGEWVSVPVVGDGAYSPMGGLLSTARDIARWGGWLADAFAASEVGQGDAVLSRASRREQQYQHTPLAAWDQLGGYGFGLLTLTDPHGGRVIAHSGGYPGYGSHMRWHPETGYGVVVLANGTYAPASLVGAELLDAIVHSVRDAGAQRPWPMFEPSPLAAATSTAREQVSRILAAWSHHDCTDAAWPEALSAAGITTEALFAENVALDVPWPLQLRQWRETIGGLHLDATCHQVNSSSPAQCTWTLFSTPTGADLDKTPQAGSATTDPVSFDVTLLMTPEPQPRVQQVSLARRPAMPPSGVRIVPMTAEHADGVRRIISEGIDSGLATFETTTPSWAEFDAKHLAAHRFVAIREADVHPPEVLGWVAASPVSDRCAYAGVVEHSVYVANAAQGLGVGRALLDHFITDTERAGIWTIQAGVLSENRASLGLHLQAGFRIVGRRERLGQLRGVWHDVLLIERRRPEN